MHENLAAFRTKFRLEEFTIHRTAAWTWSVRPSQPTLGSGILSLNRYALELHEASAEEMADLAVMLGVIERTTRGAFDHQIMNYLALMMVDRHVHYHVIPRYDGPREFAGSVWLDNGWPALPVLSDAQQQGEQSLVAIGEHLRAGLVR